LKELDCNVTRIWSIYRLYGRNESWWWQRKKKVIVTIERSLVVCYDWSMNKEGRFYEKETDSWWWHVEIDWELKEPYLERALFGKSLIWKEPYLERALFGKT
jgi:hypothetical protein